MQLLSWSAVSSPFWKVRGSFRLLFIRHGSVCAKSSRRIFKRTNASFGSSTNYSEASQRRSYRFPIIIESPLVLVDTPLGVCLSKSGSALLNNASMNRRWITSYLMPLFTNLAFVSWCFLHEAVHCEPRLLQRLSWLPRSRHGCHQSLETRHEQPRKACFWPGEKNLVARARIWASARVSASIWRTLEPWRESTSFHASLWVKCKHGTPTRCFRAARVRWYDSPQSILSGKLLAFRQATISLRNLLRLKRTMYQF